MLTTILKAIFLLQLILQIVIRTPFQLQTKDNQIEKKNQTMEDKLLLGLVFLGMMVLPLVYIFTSWLDVFNYKPHFGFILLGAVMYVFGLWLFWRAHKDLGLNWSVTTDIRKGHTLITNGVYYTVRHPMYSAIWMFVLAQPCILTNWVAGFYGILTYGMLYFLRVGEEERVMINTFGRDYLDYMGRTGRLLPKAIARKL